MNVVPVDARDRGRLRRASSVGYQAPLAARLNVQPCRRPAMAQTQYRHRDKKLTNGDC